MISYSIIRPIIAANLVTQITTSHLLFALSLVISKCSSMESSVKLVPQIFKGFCFICALVSWILTLSHNTRWNMYSSTCRVCFVYVLATCPLSSVCVYSNIFHIENKLSRHIWHDNNNCSTWVQSTCFFCLRYSLDFVNSRFVLKMFIDILPGNMKSCWFATFIYTNVSLKLQLL